MTRVFGAALLALGAAAAGFAAVARLEGRVRDISGFACGLEAMQLALTYRLATLEEMLSAAEKATVGRPQEVFRHCLAGLQGTGRRSFGGLWYEALEQLPLCLEEQDLELLRPLGGVLGRYDGDSQSETLRQTVVLLNRRMEEAAEQRRSSGKVYGAVGVSVGLFLVILLI